MRLNLLIIMHILIAFTVFSVQRSLAQTIELPEVVKKWAASRHDPTTKLTPGEKRAVSEWFPQRNPLGPWYWTEPREVVIQKFAFIFELVPAAPTQPLVREFKLTPEDMPGWKLIEERPYWQPLICQHWVWETDERKALEIRIGVFDSTESMEEFVLLYLAMPAAWQIKGAPTGKPVGDNCWWPHYRPSDSPGLCFCRANVFVDIFSQYVSLEEFGTLAQRIDSLIVARALWGKAGTVVTASINRGRKISLPVTKARDGKQLVALQFLVQQFGRKLKADKETKTVTVQLNGKKLLFKPNGHTFWVNSEPAKLSAPVKIVKNTVVVPFDFLNKVTTKPIAWKKEKGLKIAYIRF